MRLAPHVSLEVLIEVQELVWRLEANAEYQLMSQPLHGAVDGLRNELAAACVEHRYDPEESVVAEYSNDSVVWPTIETRARRVSAAL